MPIYEYTCKSCHHDFEALVRSGEAVDCPSCGSTGLDKQWSVPAAHATGTSLPICDLPSRGGGCGAPQCGEGGCGI